MYQKSLSKLTPQEYIKERIDNEIAERKVHIKKNQKWFYALRITMIISTALIPVITAIGRRIPFTMVICAALAAIASVCGGVLSIGKFQENWFEDKAINELLKQEKYLFITKSAAYGVLGTDEERFKYLVQRVESVLTRSDEEHDLDSYEIQVSDMTREISQRK